MAAAGGVATGEDVAFQGQLERVGGGGKLFGKAGQKGYFVLRSAGPAGLERLERYASADQAAQGARAIDTMALNSITAVRSINGVKRVKDGLALEIVPSAGSPVTFAAPTPAACAEWLSALRSLAFPDLAAGIKNLSVEDKPNAEQARAQMPLPPVPSEAGGTGILAHEVQENVSYASPDTSSYKVFVKPTDGAVRLGLAGSGRLLLTPIHMSLELDNKSTQPVVWPLRYLRRYGRGVQEFNFEAGRRTSTGAGVYAFEMEDHNLLFQKVDVYTKSLANERGNSLASSTSSRSPATGCNQTTAQPQFDSNGNPLTPRGYHQLAPRYEDVPRDFTPSTSGLGMPEPQYQDLPVGVIDQSVSDDESDAVGYLVPSSRGSRCFDPSAEDGIYGDDDNEGGYASVPHPDGDTGYGRPSAVGDGVGVYSVVEPVAAEAGYMNTAELRSGANS